MKNEKKLSNFQIKIPVQKKTDIKKRARGAMGKNRASAFYYHYFDF